MDGPFLSHLNVQRNANVIVTAEDDEFDAESLRRLGRDGFRVRYVSMGRNNSLKHANELHAAANQMTGISEKYAIIAYGDAASSVLETHIKITPRLCALIGYYPSVIPDKNRTRFPAGLSALVHVAGSHIGVSKRPEMLGLQGKARIVQRRLGQGIGLGGDLNLGFPCFKYDGVEVGFAEHDLEEYDRAADDLAWSRTLKTLYSSFGLRNNVDAVRDQYVNELGSDDGLGRALDITSARASVLLTPTVTGGASPEDIRRFYLEYFRPQPRQLNARLLSRTTGVDRVVDELAMSFKHDQEVPWLLPGVPATGRTIEVVIVSIVCIRGGLLVQERVYWDQASVLEQAGLLDRRNVPAALRDRGVEALPIAGADAFRAIKNEKAKTNKLMSLAKRLRGHRDSS